MMTTWTQTEVAPHLVLTVEHRVRRLVQDRGAIAQLEQTQQEDQTETQPTSEEQMTPPEQVKQTMPRYAAVPFANGWLIIQI